MRPTPMPTLTPTLTPTPRAAPNRDKMAAFVSGHPQNTGTLILALDVGARGKIGELPRAAYAGLLPQL